MTKSRGTPRRSLRVEDSLWSRFGAFCKRRGTNATARLIEHIESDLAQETPTEGSKGA
jgi:hypothetical protein